MGSSPILQQEDHQKESKQTAQSAIDKDLSYPNEPRGQDLTKLEANYITIEWHTGNDLDLLAKCACGNWTESERIRCTRCNMTRDNSARRGENSRQLVEHIVFLEPENLIGQKLEVFVRNYITHGPAQEPFVFEQQAQNMNGQSEEMSSQNIDLGDSE